MRKLITKPHLTKIDQSAVKLVTKTIHESLKEARDAAIRELKTTYILDGIGNIYKYMPSEVKGYNVIKYYAPTTENIELGLLCYTWK
jgi:hypothetical protein